jgi:hypothetical protein
MGYVIGKGIMRDVAKEIKSAVSKFPDFHSPHEGYAVIKEELDELWDDIKKEQNHAKMYNEAKQVAAMAMRFMDMLMKKYSFNPGKR